MVAPSDAGVVALQDGRSIAWTAWGAPDGATVFDQPHIGDSGRRALSTDSAALAAEGIRLVVVCRAGLGLSSRRPGRTAATDAEDMLRVIDALHVDRAHLLGECGGTGAALGLAARWPDRVSGIALVSPMAPLDGPQARTYDTRSLRVLRRVLKFGLLARWTARAQARAFSRDPERHLRRGFHSLPPVDRAFAEDPEWRTNAANGSAEFYSSAEPFLDEYRSILGPWGFQISDVRCLVSIDHGGSDATTPIAMASWLADHLSWVELSVDPDRGHFIASARLAAIMRALVDRESAV